LDFLAADFAHSVGLLRLFERAFILIVITVLTIVLMLTFRHKIQTIEVEAAKFNFSVAATFTAPIFLLLGYIGFSWIVFASPISVSASADDKLFAGAALPEDQAKADKVISAMVGVIATPNLIANYRETGDEALLDEVVRYTAPLRTDLATIINDTMQERGFPSGAVFGCLPDAQNPRKKEESDCREFNSILWQN
jgi:hypothetical protein